MQNLENRITELEIQTALQADAIDSLSGTIAKMQQVLDLQQGQLKLLYQRLQDRGADNNGAAFAPADEVPPHY